jgi:hypothetical protein
MPAKHGGNIAPLCYAQNAGSAFFADGKRAASAILPNSAAPPDAARACSGAAGFEINLL